MQRRAPVEKRQPPRIRIRIRIRRALARRVCFRNSRPDARGGAVRRARRPRPRQDQPPRGSLARGETVFAGSRSRSRGIKPGAIRGAIRAGNVRLGSVRLRKRRFRLHRGDGVPTRGAAFLPARLEGREHVLRAHAVQLVPHDREPRVRQVQPDLVRAPGQGPRQHERRARHASTSVSSRFRPAFVFEYRVAEARAQRLVLGGGGLAVRCHRTDAPPAVVAPVRVRARRGVADRGGHDTRRALAETRVARAFFFFFVVLVLVVRVVFFILQHRAHREVGLARPALLELRLQRGGALLVLRQQQHAGRAPVQPVRRDGLGG